MKRANALNGWWLRRLVYLLAGSLACVCLLSLVLALAATSPENSPAWASPRAMALKRIGGLATAQNEPNFLDNLDCVLVSYRQPASSNMKTGCFTETAYGLMDSDSDTIIYNGTDEGLPLLPYAPNQVLVPWPEAYEMLSLSPVNTGGSYLSLYKNPLLAINDQRNLLLQLTAKQLTGPADYQIKDRAGQRLVINPQTMAFAYGGAWLVAETLNGSFVRINLATQDIFPFAPAFNAPGVPGLFMSRVAVSHDGRYIAIANDASSTFKVYDLSSCTHTSVNLEPEKCSSYDYWPFVGQQVKSLRSIRHLRFVNDGLLSFEARTTTPDDGGTYELAPSESITSLIDYLALGDSFTSGEGAFDYLAGTDTADNTCHLSARSYPLLLTHDLFTALGGRSVACSGAVISDVGSNGETYKGQVRGSPEYRDLKRDNPALLDSVMANFIPGYVAQQRFVGQYQPALITVSIGGNDIGFGDVLEQCVMPHVSRHLSDSTCFGTYEDRLEVTKLIDRTVPRWTRLFKQLQAKAPGARVYVIGYPSLASDQGRCGLNVNLGKAELEFAEEIIAYLDDSIHEAADQAGATYVDISQALSGHRLCEAASYNVAVNGLTAGRDAFVFGKESYHPNALGQLLMERAILDKTHNLTIGSPPAPAVKNSTKLLQAPKSGRTVHSRVPASQMTPKTAKKGRAAPVKVKGSTAGLRPKTAYTTRLDGPTGTIIGSLTTDENGDIDSSVTIPGDTASGGHSLDLTGDGQGDEPVDVTLPIYVPDSDHDADGDGIADTIDSCVAAVNSGIDADQDHIDDVCDDFIGLPSASTDNSASSGPPAAGPILQGGSPNPPLTTSLSGLAGRVAAITKPGAPAINLPAATVSRPRLQPFGGKNQATLPRLKSSRQPSALAKLPSINWQPWIEFYSLLWLLLVLLGLWWAHRSKKLVLRYTNRQ